MQEQLWIHMKRKGISQTALAKRLHISDKTLSLKLRGEADFWWREVVLLSEILGIKNPLEVIETPKKAEEVEAQ